MTAPTDPKDNVIVYDDYPRAGLLAFTACADPTGHYYRGLHLKNMSDAESCLVLGDVYHVVLDTTRRQGSGQAAREVNDDCTANGSVSNTMVIR